MYVCTYNTYCYIAAEHVNMHAVCKLCIRIYTHIRMYILYRSTHYIRTYICMMFAGQYPQISDDLVNSHHLLLCCVDTLYNAVLLGDKMDLINMESLRAGVWVGGNTHTYIVLCKLYIVIVCMHTCTYVRMCTSMFCDNMHMDYIVHML